MTRVSILAALSVSLLGGWLATPAKADESNKETVIKIDQPVRVDKTVLLPGSYIFQLANSDSSRDIVQIFNADNNNLVTTVIGMRAERVEPVDNTKLDFYPVLAGETAALRTWYFAGETDGIEFRTNETTIPALARTNPAASSSSSAGGMK